MCYLNREPVLISIFLDREIDVEIDVVVAKTSSDDPLARLGFGPNLELCGGSRDLSTKVGIMRAISLRSLVTLALRSLSSLIILALPSGSGSSGRLAFLAGCSKLLPR